MEMVIIISHDMRYQIQMPDVSCVEQLAKLVSSILTVACCNTGLLYLMPQVLFRWDVVIYLKQNVEPMPQKNCSKLCSIMFFPSKDFRVNFRLLIIAFTHVCRYLRSLHSMQETTQCFIKESYTQMHVYKHKLGKKNT